MGESTVNGQFQQLCLFTRGYFLRDPKTKFSEPPNIVYLATCTVPPMHTVGTGVANTHSDDRKSSSGLSHLNLQMLKIRGEDQQGTECLSSTTSFVCILIFFGQIKSNQSISWQGFSQHPTVGEQRAAFTFTFLPSPISIYIFLSISHVYIIWSVAARWSNVIQVLKLAHFQCYAGRRRSHSSPPAGSEGRQPRP